MSSAAIALIDRDAWLAERMTGIGGSEAAAVMGANPWKSAYAVWAEKTGLAPADATENEAMEWGKRLEPVIAAKYAETTSRKIELNGASGLELLRHPEHPYMLATIDARVYREDVPGILEIKTTGAHRAEEWLEAAPLAYQVQLQHYLATTGLAWGSFAVLIGGQKFRWYDVERNDNFIATLEERCAWFWDLVQRREPPPIDGSQSTTDALRALYPQDSGATVDLGIAAADWADQLAAAKDRMCEAERQKREIENKIKAAMGPATFGIVPGGGRFSFKTQRREEHVVAASEFRVLRYAKEKSK